MTGTEAAYAFMQQAFFYGVGASAICLAVTACTTFIAGARALWKNIP